MRLASRDRDFWELRSGEKSHEQNPDSFWIPPRAERENLRRGQGVRLIFDIEAVDEDGHVEIQGERMWVLVAERRGDVYIGILDNEPASLEPAEDVYLCRGAEIAFLPEHVIDIDEPPVEYVEHRLTPAPTRRWPPENPTWESPAPA